MEPARTRFRAKQVVLSVPLNLICKPLRWEVVEAVRKHCAVGPASCILAERVAAP